MAAAPELEEELLELDEELLELEEELLELDEELLELGEGDGSEASPPPQAATNTLLANASTRVRITASPHDHFYYGFLR